MNMKKTTRWLAGVLSLTLLLCLTMPASAASLKHGTADSFIKEDMLNNTPPKDYAINPKSQSGSISGGYNSYFLKDSLQTVSITIDENNLNYLLQNAIDEPYVMTTSVTIGDTTLGYCGLRTKGNYTLAHAFTDNPGSDRFSFTVNFGEYITKELYGEKQCFYGCDKISFNNFFFDKSMMKEFFALELMEQMGLPTPQHGLAKLYINGEYYGVYAMIENLDKPLLEQYFGVDGDALSSYLCKPTGTNLLYSHIQKDPSPLYEYDEEKRLKVEDMLPTAMEWVRRLNCLSSGTDFDGNTIDVNSDGYLELLAQVMDIDETVRYFAVHSWLCQLDNMFTERQNFALYISPEGISTLVPWDYDLAFGCFWPSTAEATANYPLNVMYKLDSALFSQADNSAARVYSTYPLFNVIYQNEALMERYHSYMLDCSRIAALGGQAGYSGKTYDPGYFHSMMEAIKEELIQAASEPLADNVYYMNRISQPRDVQNALPNLSRIIALRAVGVWTQIEGVDATVCGSSCDLETIGNAVSGGSSNAGTLTVVDAPSGIFATARFEGNRRSPSPALYATPLEKGDVAYDKVAAQLQPGRSDSLTVYQMNIMGNPVSDFTLTVPLAQAHLEEGMVREFYTLTGDTLTRLDMTQEGNLFTGTSPKMANLVILVRDPYGWVETAILAAAAAVAVAAVTAVLLRRIKKEKNG